MSQKLKKVQQHNEELASEIKRVEFEIEKLKKENERLRNRRDELISLHQAIQKSLFWRLFTLLRQKENHPLLKFAKRLRTLIRGQSTAHRKKRAKQRINKLKYMLYEFGFTEKGVAELQQIFEEEQNVFLKQMAAWELALWYANKYNKDDAQRCLTWLSKAMEAERDASMLRKAAVIEAECLHLLGKVDQAKTVLRRVLLKEEHGDLLLGLANLEHSAPKRLEWINRTLQLYGLTEVSLDISASSLETNHFPNHETAGKKIYDCLYCQPQKRDDLADTHATGNNAAKVSVIIPAHNAAEVIETSLQSILNQTWTNLEVLVVDDCSTDKTVGIVESYMRKDSRIQLLKTKTNSGAYVARNLALQKATGDFVTVNDADDWSHPEKIEKQVRHLLDNPSIIANTSQQARATEELHFHRRGKPGAYLFPNLSSLMFRRVPVMERLGYWDSVRFGADGEFKRRLQKVFGEKTVVDLETGPLSFQRQTKRSLTGNKAFGFHGFFMGARKEYFESYTYFHQHADSLKYDFPQSVRPFAVPEPLKPNREVHPSVQRHFDVIIASEFRLLGGTNMSNAEEIKAQKRLGLRTGLIQLARYDFRSEKCINPQIRELIDGDRVQMIVHGEKVSCDVLIVRHPPILQEWQQYMPKVEAKNVRVIVNQPPQRDYGEDGQVLYDIETCKRRLEAYFGDSGIWHPIGPQIRDALIKYHEEELHTVELADEDWVNIIDVDEWRRPKRPARHSKIRIGRHSRPQYVKWPADPDELLQIYPDSNDYEIHVLGGAKAPRQVLGTLPSNWYVYEFGQLDPKDFLATLDVFVYYTHPDWIEAFGRVIFEAMAVGVPVIIPPDYKNLFGEAAIYAEPAEVQDKIRQLMSNDVEYERQVEIAHRYVEEHFGYSKHASRLIESGLKTDKAMRLSVSE